MRHVCLLLCVLLAIVARARGEESKSHQVILEACVKEFGQDNAILEAPKLDVEKPEVKCILACVMKKSWGMMVDGKVVIEKEKIKIQIDLEKFFKCVDTANQLTNECEVAAYYYKHCLEESTNPSA